jgi:hypothetical protein
MSNMDTEPSIVARVAASIAPERLDLLIGILGAGKARRF